MAGFVQNQGTNATLDTINSITLTLAANVAAGNHVIVAGWRLNTSDDIASITTSIGGATTHIDAAGVNLNDATNTMGVGSVYFPAGATTSDTITITWTAGVAFDRFTIVGTEVTGLATSNWWDQTAQASTFHAIGTGAGQGIESGSTGVLSQASELVYGALWFNDNTETLVAGTGYTLHTQFTTQSVSKGGVETKVVAATTAVEAKANWTTAATGDEGAIVVTYKIAAASGPTAAQLIPAFTQTGGGYGVQYV